MYLLLKTSIIINIFTIIAMLVCYCYSLNKNATSKMKEVLGVIFAVPLILHILTLSLLVILGLIKHNWLNFVLLPFPFAPFVIGHFSKSDKVFKYTMIQLVAFLISLMLLIFLSM